MADEELDSFGSSSSATTKREELPGSESSSQSDVVDRGTRRRRQENQPLERLVPLKWAWVERVPLKWMEITFMILLSVSVALLAAFVHVVGGQLFTARYLMVEAIMGNFTTLTQSERLTAIGRWRYDTFLAWIAVSLGMMFLPIITVGSPVSLHRWPNLCLLRLHRAYHECGCSSGAVARVPSSC